MAKIARYNGNLVPFASSALGTERTIFGEVTQADDITSQFTADFLRGWGIVGPSDQPTLQDFNAVSYTHGQILAYLHQMGVAEYNAAQEYHLGSFATVGGVLYASLANNNTGNTPASSPTQWGSISQRGLVSFSTPGSGSWPVPLIMQLGIIKPRVTVTGAGGSGGLTTVVPQRGAGGGGGGTAIKLLDLTGVTSVSYTVGAGATPATGGSSTFGAFCSATGGTTGLDAGAGGTGGVGLGGDINLSGGQGTDSGVGGAGGGGTSYWGGSVRGGDGIGVTGPATAYGAGAGGSVTVRAAGIGGIIVLEW